jgi:hypothetical protein
MTEPHTPPTAHAHARHDPELIAALAAREPDLPARELAAARELVGQCGDCRDLLADLLTLQVALPATDTPTRPRDFTLTPADARELRGSGWRRILGFFGSTRDAFSRPLAIGFTTIGVVALLITAVPSIPLGGAGGAAVLSTVGNAVPEGAGGAAPSAAPAAASAAAPAAAPSAAPSAAAENQRQSVTAEPYSTATDEGGVFTGSNEGTGDIQGTTEVESQGDSGPLSLSGDNGVSLGVVIAGISLIIGFGLFALRWSSRRFGEG